MHGWEIGRLLQDLGLGTLQTCQVFFLQMWESGCYQVGPNISYKQGEIPPFRDEIAPLSHLFSAIYRGCNVMYN